MTLQPTRLGFACYGAAHAAFVEAHRQDDADKNRVCLPSGYHHDVYDWARMWLAGAQSDAVVLQEPDLRRWSRQTRLNAGRVDPSQRDNPAVLAVRQRVKDAVLPGLTRLARLVESTSVAPSPA